MDAAGPLLPRLLEAAFARYAVVIGRHTAVFLLAPVLLTALLSSGWLRFSMQDDMVKLFTPINSEWDADRQRFEEFFGFNQDGFKFVFIFMKDDLSNKTLLDDSIVPQVADILHTIEEELYVNYNGTDYHYIPDLCLNESPYYLPNRLVSTYLVDRAYPQLRGHMKPPALTYPVTNELGHKLFLPFVYGGVTTNDSSRVTGIRAVLMRYAFSQATADDRQLALAFEQRLNEFCSEGIGADSAVDARVDSWRSFSGEVRHNTWLTLRQIPGAVALTLTFTVLVCCSCRLSQSCHLHAVAGLVSVVMSFVSSVGLMLHLGVRYNDLVSITSFLALAIGVDDAFIMLSAWRRHSHVDERVQRLAATLADAGSSITFTSATDILAFGIGVSLRVPALRDFCAFTAVAILFDFIYQVSFFPAAILFIERYSPQLNGCVVDVWQQCRWRLPLFHSTAPLRRAGRGSAGAPKTSQAYMVPNEVRAPCDLYVVPFGGGATTAAPGLFDSDDSCDSSSRSGGECSASCSSLESRRGDCPIVNALFWLVSSRVCQGLLLVLTVLLTGVATYGITTLKPNSNLSKLIVDASPMQRVSSIFDRYFWSEALLFHCVVKSPDMANATDVDRFMQFVERLETMHNAVGPAATELWLREFFNYADEFEIGAELWLEEVDNYIRSDIGTLLRDVHTRPVVQGERVLRVPSAFHFTTGFWGSDDWAARARFLNELSAVKAEFGEFEPAFFNEIIFLTDLLLYTETAMRQTLAIALLCTLTVTLLFLPARRYSLVFAVSATFISINTCVLGLLALWHTDIDVLSMGTLLMSVGFSVDYTVHMAYQLGRNAANSRLDRRSQVYDSLDAVARPILKAGMSTLVAVCLMIFVHSYMIRVFLKTILLVVCMGLMQSLLILPVLFLVTGIRPRDAAEERRRRRMPDSSRTLSSTPNRSCVLFK